MTIAYEASKMLSMREELLTQDDLTLIDCVFKEMFMVARCYKIKLINNDSLAILEAEFIKYLVACKGSV